jgi:hypothetical protein
MDELFYGFLRRVTSELMQFKDPNEAFRMTSTPFASLHVIENNIKFLETLYNTLNPLTETPTYKGGANKGDLKIWKSSKNLIPVLNRLGISNQKKYNYLANVLTQ